MLSRVQNHGAFCMPLSNNCEVAVQVHQVTLDRLGNFGSKFKVSFLLSDVLRALFTYQWSVVSGISYFLAAAHCESFNSQYCMHGKLHTLCFIRHSAKDQYLMFGGCTLCYWTSRTCSLTWTKLNLEPQPNLGNQIPRLVLLSGLKGGDRMFHIRLGRDHKKLPKIVGGRSLKQGGMEEKCLPVCQSQVA